jgi:hypothetical protein
VSGHHFSNGDAVVAIRVMGDRDRHERRRPQPRRVVNGRTQPLDHLRVRSRVSRHTDVDADRASELGTRPLMHHLDRVVTGHDDAIRRHAEASKQSDAFGGLAHADQVDPGQDDGHACEQHGIAHRSEALAEKRGRRPSSLRQLDRGQDAERVLGECIGEHAGARADDEIGSPERLDVANRRRPSAAQRHRMFHGDEGARQHRPLRSETLFDRRQHALASRPAAAAPSCRARDW